MLESANIKLASVLSDIDGVSGRAMLSALIKGTAVPVEIAQLTTGRLKAKRDDLKLTLEGRDLPPFLVPLLMLVLGANRCTALRLCLA